MAVVQFAYIKSDNLRVVNGVRVMLAAFDSANASYDTAAERKAAAEALLATDMNCVVPSGYFDTEIALATMDAGNDRLLVSGALYKNAIS